MVTDDDDDDDHDGDDLAGDDEADDKGGGGGGEETGYDGSEVERNRTVTARGRHQHKIIVDDSATYRVQTELVNLTSRLEILKPEELLKGRYFCLMSCSSDNIYNISCLVSKFEYRKNTHMCTLTQNYSAAALIKGENS
nr:hypothetical protein BaRGS_013585 [Batillaria attramentaria]